MAKNPNSTVVQTLLQKVESSQNPDIYSNHAEISFSGMDFIIDFYRLGRKVGSEVVSATHIQRVYLPLNLAKGITSAIANLIGTYEKDANITLPNSRTQQEGDVFDLWK